MSQGCTNRCQKTVGSDNRGFFPPGSRGQKAEIQVSQGYAPSGGSVEGPPCLFQLLGAPGVLGLWLQSLPLSSKASSLSLLYCLLQGHSLALGFTLIRGGLILILTLYLRLFFQI